jgi:thioredoxin-related protein
MQNRKAFFLLGIRRFTVEIGRILTGISRILVEIACMPGEIGRLPARGRGVSLFFWCCLLLAGCARKPAAPEGANVGADGGSGEGRIEWMSLEQAAGSQATEKRPVLIDLYTDWCGWCRQMDRKTYSNRQVAQYIREKFYPVKVDAESRSAISWNGSSYSFDQGSRTNSFAVDLTHGRLEFPTTIIIPPGEEPQAIPGYMAPRELELLVKYFGEGNNHKMSFGDYQKNFKASW